VCIRLCGAERSEKIQLSLVQHLQSCRKRLGKVSHAKCTFAGFGALPQGTRSPMSNITADACPGGTECASINMECSKARCICAHVDGMGGPRCDDLTLRALPMLIVRTAELLVFVPLAVLFSVQLRRTWLASHDCKRVWVFKFLIAPLALILCGLCLMIMDAVRQLLTGTATLQLTYVEGKIANNLLNGLGTLFLNLGFAVIPMLWCEIGLASSRFQRMHNTLLLSRRFLLFFLFLNVITAIALTVVSPLYPFYAEQWLALVAVISVFIIVIEHSTGAWMLSRALSMAQGVRPDSLPPEPKPRRGSINAEAATRKAKSTARFFNRCSGIGLLGIVLWQFGYDLAYTHSEMNYSPVVLWVGICLMKVVAIPGLSVCELRYIRWTVEATKDSIAVETVKTRCRNDGSSRRKSCEMSFQDEASGSCAEATGAGSLKHIVASPARDAAASPAATPAAPAPAALPAVAATPAALSDTHAKPAPAALPAVAATPAALSDTHAKPAPAALPAVAATPAAPSETHAKPAPAALPAVAATPAALSDTHAKPAPAALPAAAEDQEGGGCLIS
jgi:hypothetical protein